jgi:undecaprenyl diphosphate synthase
MPKPHATEHTPGGAAGVPRHVALIMDGGGRWAERAGLPRHAGHIAGQAAATRAVLALDGLGVSWVTLFAFSAENWQRPAAEVRSVLGLIEGYVRDHMQLFDERNIRMRFIGRARGLPASLAAAMDAARALTGRNTGMTLTTAVSYGGRAELADAVRRMIADGVPAAEVTEERIRDYLYDPQLPDPDLIIRTAGEQRTSGFMPWQAVYSELMFLTEPWPDLTAKALARALEDYQHRVRRFGGLARAGLAGSAR